MHIILFSTDTKSHSNVENTILPGKSFKIQTLGKKTARALGSASQTTKWQTRLRWGWASTVLVMAALLSAQPHRNAPLIENLSK